MEHVDLTEHTANRPMVYTKMEGLVREMQDPESGVPVRSQKLFLTSIPAAFMGYDLIEWLMERLNIEDSAEAVHLANLLCQSGYFFPVTDNKNLSVKDDSSLYRFQTPYYWPSSASHGHSPDNLEYAIYLAKRSLRNKQRHGLEDHELEALNNLKKTLQNKWDFVTMQAEEQVRLAKDRKKGDKIVTDSQERAYWRVYRPPPGCPLLEIMPLPLAACRIERQQKAAVRGKTLGDWRKEVMFLRSCMDRTRLKTSQALDNLVQHANTFLEYDAVMTPVMPSNPWHSDDPTFWQLNSLLVEVPTERRVRRWALAMEELVSDPTGLQEFTNYLRKEYSHENIRFWTAVNDLRRSSQSQIQVKVREIYDEFLAAGAPCEINIDGKTMERTQTELRAPSRFSFDAAAEHVYTLLLKKDCYPRFVRSEHYKALLAAGVQPAHKKRFFNFSVPTKKKTSTSGAPNGGANNVSAGTTPMQPGTGSGRGSVTHEVSRGSASVAAAAAATAASAGVGGDVLTPPTRPGTLPASLSHSNVAAEMRCETPYRGDLPALTPSISNIRLPPLPWSSVELTSSSKDAEEGKVCPWDSKPPPSSTSTEQPVKDGVCPWDDASPEPLPRAASMDASAPPTVPSVVTPCVVPVTPAVVPVVPVIRVHAASSVDDDPDHATEDKPPPSPTVTTEVTKVTVSEVKISSSAEVVTEVLSQSGGSTEAKATTCTVKGESSSTVPTTTTTTITTANAAAAKCDDHVVPPSGEKNKEVCPWEDE